MGLKPSECEKHFEILFNCIWSATKKAPTNAEKKLEKQRKKDKKKEKKEKKKLLSASGGAEPQIQSKRFTVQQLGKRMKTVCEICEIIIRLSQQRTC
jgi:hypothetical protein